MPGRRFSGQATVPGSRPGSRTATTCRIALQETPSFSKSAAPPYVASAIATTVANAVVLFGYVDETGDGTWTPPAMLQTRAEEDFLLAADLDLSTQGSSGTPSAGYSTSASPGMIVVGALAPNP